MFNKIAFLMARFVASNLFFSFFFFQLYDTTKQSIERLKICVAVEVVDIWKTQN